MLYIFFRLWPTEGQNGGRGWRARTSTWRLLFVIVVGRAYRVRLCKRVFTSLDLIACFSLALLLGYEYDCVVNINIDW